MIFRCATSSLFEQCQFGDFIIQDDIETKNNFDNILGDSLPFTGDRTQRTIILSGNPSHYVSVCTWDYTQVLCLPTGVCYPIGHSGR